MEEALNELKTICRLLSTLQFTSQIEDRLAPDMRGIDKSVGERRRGQRMNADIPPGVNCTPQIERFWSLSISTGAVSIPCSATARARARTEPSRLRKRSSSTNAVDEELRAAPGCEALVSVKITAVVVPQHGDVRAQPR